MKKRIWELDALRGICIIGVVIVHFLYDLVELFAIVDWHYPEWFLFIRNWGSVLFFLISGICVTLGSRSVRRGLIVVGGGMLCTLATYGMYKFGGFHKSIMIYFGVLHCLGCCMLLWPLVKRLPAWALAVLAVVLVALGLHIDEIPVENPWLTVIGFPCPGMGASDHFPLLPYFGYFLAGAAIGRWVYRKRESLLPSWEGHALLRPFCFCGRHSLWIYLLHQPVAAGICYLLMLF